MSNRTGEIRRNKEHLGNYEMKIIEYICYNDIWVEFQDEHKAKVHTKYCHFKNGSVKNPYHPNVFNIGYLGEGKFKTCDKNGDKTLEYIAWHNLLKRCYDPYTINRHLTYKDCYVCDEWLNFQNFAKWYEENYYECNNETMCLDKDILVKGNKIYSPKTCMFVPERINILFVKNDAVRGKYPVGVYQRYCRSVLKLCSRCSIIDVNNKNKRVYLGDFPLNRPFQAFYTYKIFKENYIKQVADEYKDLIPNKLYEALYKWEVEIND